MDSDDTLNPYAPPASADAYVLPADAQGGMPAPEYKLYSVGAVVLATFLGTMIAGGIVLALNLFRLQRAATGWLVLAGSVAGTVLTVAIAAVVPDDANVPNSVYIAPQLLIAYFVADGLVGKAIRAHQQARGQMASNWGAAGIGLLFAVIFIIVTVALLILAEL